MCMDHHAYSAATCFVTEKAPNSGTSGLKIIGIRSNTVLSDSSYSFSIRYLAKASTVTMQSLWVWQNLIRSGMRDIVPSSLTISQMTPAGDKPDKIARSTAATVFPLSARAGGVLEREH